MQDRVKNVPLLKVSTCVAGILTKKGRLFASPGKGSG